MKSTKTLFVLLISLFTKLSFAQNGLTELAPLPNLTTIDKRSISDLETDAQGNLWVAFGMFKTTTNTLLPSRALMVLQNKVWRVIKTDSLGGPLCRNIEDLALINGSLYAASSNGLLDLGSGNQCVAIKYSGPGASPATDSINHINFHNGLIYLSTQGGLLEYNPISSSNPWKIFTSSTHAIPDNRINSSAKDAQNNLWLATQLGVIKIEPGSTNSTWFSRTNGNFHTDPILSIAVTNNGKVWAGTISRPYLNDEEKSYSNGNDGLPGLYLLQNNQFKNIAFIQNPCSFAYLPAYNFRKITTLNNEVVFIGAMIKGYGISNRYYAAYYQINDNLVKETPLKPFEVNPGNYSLTTANQNKLFSFLPFAPNPLEIELDKLIPDSTYYNELSTPYTYQMQDINNLKAPISTMGDMFWDGNQKNMKVANSDCGKIAFSSALWMGGIADGNLHLAAGTYRQSGLDYDNGPLNINNGSLDSNIAKQFNRVFKLEKRTIEEFKSNYQKPGYQIPEAILNWPAQGDTSKGIAHNLHPFFDANQNGKYEPTLGDYPLINGQQELFRIYNDNRLHTESESVPMGVEIASRAYAYVCKDINNQHPNKVVNNSTLYSFTITNRSNKTYQNFRVGFWLDCDLGNYADDFIGSNPKEGYMFWYNADSLDNGKFGFGSTPPAAALVALEMGKDSAGNPLPVGGMVTYQNDFSVLGNPSRPEHYYNYLSNRWKDGTPVTYGGFGKNGTDSNQVFMYPGKNDVLGRPEWSEETTGNLPGDRRLMVNSAAMTLKPGQSKTFTYAIVFTPSLGKNKASTLADLEADVKKVKTWFAKDSFPSCSNIPLGFKEIRTINKQSGLMCYPNPSDYWINIRLEDGSVPSRIQVFDVSGKMVKNLFIGNLDSINIADLPQGLYLMVVESKTGKHSSRFVKN